MGRRCFAREEESGGNPRLKTGLMSEDPRRMANDFPILGGVLVAAFLDHRFVGIL